MLKHVPELLFCALEVGLLLAYLFWGFGLLLFALLAVAISHLLWRRKQKRPNEDWLSSYCHVLGAKYSASGALVHSVEKVCSDLGSSPFSEIPRRFRLGDDEPSRNSAPPGFTKSLYEMLGFSIKTGRSVRSSVEKLHRSLLHETKSKNLTSAKVGTMSSITYLGLVFFLPMFGAVSSTIFSTLSTSAAASAGSAQNLAFAVLIYIALGLYITAYAYGERRRFSEMTSAILPLLSVAAFVLFFTYTYISTLL